MTQDTGRIGRTAWAIAGVVVGLALLGVVFFLLPRWRVRACAGTDQASQLSGRCLTTEQRLKAESDVRTSGVQALGGLALLGGIYFTWRQVQLGRDQLVVNLETAREQYELSRRQLAQSLESTRQTLESTRQLAVDAHAHEREMATEERRQERMAGAYVKLVEAVFRTQAYWQFRVQDAGVEWARPPTPPPEPPVTEKVMAIAAKVHAFGSPVVKGLFEEFTEAVNQVQRDVAGWDDARARDPAGTKGVLVPDLGRIRRVNELARAIQDRVHAELDELGERPPIE